MSLESSGTILYTGCNKRSGQSLWWWFRTLFGTKNPNTLFPNSSPFPSYAIITHLSSFDSMAILSLSSVVNCLYLVNCSVSPSLLAPTSSKGWLEQILKMSPYRTNTCFISLISCYTLPSLRWCISIAVVLIFATSSSLLPISVSYTFSFMQPQRKKSSGVRFGDLFRQTTGPPLPIHLPGKLWCNHRRTGSVKCDGVSSSWYHRCRDCKGISSNIGIITSSMEFR